MSTRRRWTIGGVAATIIALVGSVVVVISENIASNHIDAYLNSMWSPFSAFVARDEFPWFVIGGVLLAWGITALGFVLYWRRRSSVLNQAMNTANNLLDLDDSLLRLLASWIVAKDHQAEMKRLLAELLRDSSAEFYGLVHRAMILLPDDRGQYLKVWAHFGLSDLSAGRIKFYVGNDPDLQNLRGVAGNVFSTGSLRVGYMLKERGSWKCSCSDFVPFVGKHPLYRSFVCVPVFGVNPASPLSNPICIGVLSFDSMDGPIFNTSEVQVLLRVIARRVGSALLIYQQLQASANPSQPPTYFIWSI